MSTKNRKNHIREINVNGQVYKWLVSDYNCDGDGSMRFKIWENKVLIFNEVINIEVVNPEIVRNKILAIKQSPK